MSIEQARSIVTAFVLGRATVRQYIEARGILRAIGE